MEHEISTSCCASARLASREASGKPRTRERAENTLLEGMIQLPGGTFLMGTDYGQGFPQDGEEPVRKIRLAPFFISRYATTNAEFSTFVEETGYETEAERFGWSFVFYRTLSARAKRECSGRSTAREPLGTTQGNLQGHPRRLLSVPQVPLQPLPGGGAQPQYP